MTDSAKGPGAGYIYQYERALLLLASLEGVDEYISIEMVDDVASHKNEKNVLLSIQAKHSIQQNSTTFKDTSVALWRTFQIWIEKLKNSTYSSTTHFICSTNKPISKTSLLYKLTKQTFDVSILLIKQLLQNQKDKLQNTSNGKSIKKTIDLIEFSLNNKDLLKIIIQNLHIECQTSIRSDFFNAVHLNSKDITDLQRENAYNTLYGWLVYSCNAFWSDNRDAIFHKRDFDTRLNRIMNNPSIVNAIFRKKSDILKNHNILYDNYRKALFVSQIEDIPRNKSAKERIITAAIIDYICSEIELNQIIDTCDFTKKDFQEFSDLCYQKWQECVDSNIIYELDEYSDKEKNDFAIQIFDQVMKELSLQFDEAYSFSDSTRYIQNGTFLKLSDIPEIGWHPEWENKYKK